DILDALDLSLAILLKWQNKKEVECVLLSLFETAIQQCRKEKFNTLIQWTIQQHRSFLDKPLFRRALRGAYNCPELSDACIVFKYGTHGEQSQEIAVHSAILSL